MYYAYCIPFHLHPSWFLIPPPKKRPPLPFKTTEATSGFCLGPEVPPRPRALQSDGEVFDVKALSDLTLTERQRLLCLGRDEVGDGLLPTETKVVSALCLGPRLHVNARKSCGSPHKKCCFLSILTHVGHVFVTLPYALLRYILYTCPNLM